jgi:hypothetical protein
MVDSVIGVDVRLNKFPVTKRFVLSARNMGISN